jgi:8-oxo-dGTP pyrophosphatase MutT (NUDIX family)
VLAFVRGSDYSVAISFMRMPDAVAVTASHVQVFLQSQNKKGFWKRAAFGGWRDPDDENPFFTAAREASEEGAFKGDDRLIADLARYLESDDPCISVSRQSFTDKKTGEATIKKAIVFRVLLSKQHSELHARLLRQLKPREFGALRQVVNGSEQEATYDLAWELLKGIDKRGTRHRDKRDATRQLPVYRDYGVSERDIDRAPDGTWVWREDRLLEEPLPHGDSCS